MKKILLLTLFLIVSMLIISCEEKNPVQSPSGVPQDNSGSPTAGESAGGKSVWPPINKDDSVGLAKNLLAKNYYVVLDGSGSMEGRECSGEDSKAVASKKALIEFSQAVPADANLGLLAFDGQGVTERLPLGINNRVQFVDAVNAVDTESNTPLHEAIVKGYQAIEKQAQAQLGYGEYYLVIVTDGEANEGPDPEDAVNWILDNTPVVIHTIGFCIDENHSLNQPGRTHYATAQNPKELISGLKAVLAESEVFDVSSFK